MWVSVKRVWRVAKITSAQRQTTDALLGRVTRTLHFVMEVDNHAWGTVIQEKWQRKSSAMPKRQRTRCENSENDEGWVSFAEREEGTDGHDHILAVAGLGVRGVSGGWPAGRRRIISGLVITTIGVNRAAAEERCELCIVSRHVRSFLDGRRSGLFGTLVLGFFEAG